METADIINTIIKAVPIIISFAAALMAILPQGRPGSDWDKARTYINYAAMNWGSAKNQRQL